MDLSEIIIGWKNYIFPNEEVEKIATNRMISCLNCTKLINKSKKCSVCGCYTPAKVRSLKSKCPINKW